LTIINGVWGLRPQPPEALETAGGT
jgi:hypothetical protein